MLVCVETVPRSVIGELALLAAVPWHPGALVTQLAPGTLGEVRRSCPAAATGKLLAAFGAVGRRPAAAG